MSAEPIISFRNVCKAFGPKVVLRGFDLDVYKGETLVVIGGSGVGKSVMLKLLIGLLEADQGTITYMGEDVTKMGPDGLRGVRKRVAMLFQGGALFDSMSVE
ncbi:MAG: ATP-binding cassette domain-containing protein, partial [Polyangiaceae bacterium]